MVRPGLDQPPGRGEGDLDMSMAGVPGIGGRVSPNEALDMPLVAPAELFRLRVGGCFAAEERLRRWPDEAEKEFGEARAKDVQRFEGRGIEKRRCAWLEVRPQAFP